MGDSIFKQLASFQYSAEAYICKGKLESIGIDVFIRDNNTVDADPLFSNAIGGVKLFVKTEDYPLAIMELKEIGRYSIDDNGKHMVCPKCGSERVELLSTIKDSKSFFSFAFSLLMVALPFYTRYKFKCGQCGFEYNQL